VVGRQEKTQLAMDFSTPASTMTVENRLRLKRLSHRRRSFSKKSARFFVTKTSNEDVQDDLSNVLGKLTL